MDVVMLKIREDALQRVLLVEAHVGVAVAVFNAYNEVADDGNAETVARELLVGYLGIVLFRLDELVVEVKVIGVARHKLACAHEYLHKKAVQLRGSIEIVALLNRYLNKKEVAYYMTRIRKVAKRFPDTFTQVIMVIQGKEKQPKFIKGTKQYKRNAIIDYVLKENLKEFGWSIEPPASRKERARDLIETV